MTCFYWDNLYAFGLAPTKGSDGVYSWSFPMGDKRLAGLAVEDIGKVAYGIFAGRSTVHRKDRWYYRRKPDPRSDEREAPGRPWNSGKVPRR